jgi:hypothetical protein
MAALLMAYVGSAHSSSHDAIGGGALRMYTIAHFDAMGPDTRMLVYSRVVLGEGRKLREIVFFNIEKHDGEWSVRATLAGLQLADEIVVKLIGGAANGITYTGWNPVDGTKAVATKGLWYGAHVRVTDTQGECLNIRNAPGTGEVLTCLPDGEVVTITGDPVEMNGTLFWEVSARGQLRGYASGDYLTAFNGQA